MMKPAYTGSIWLDGRKSYTAKEGYSWLIGRRDKVSGYHWVSNSVNLPKHSLSSCLVAINKLRTIVQLAKAGFCPDTTCLLYGNKPEDCLHLFFRCVYSNMICQAVMNWLGMQSSRNENVFTYSKIWGRKYRSKKRQKV